MKLTYHKGKNFGDALNPVIFNNLLPDFFDQDPKKLFLGIGTILGLKRPGSKVNNVIVFSSGIGGKDKKTYGTPPPKNILNKYDFRCVRGPLTAKLFNLSPECSVCDGAILLSEVVSGLENHSKKYKYSYMPHVGTLDYFPNWRKLVNSRGIQFIDPTGDINYIINEIVSSEILFSEAMHGAIVADTFRVPWIPVKSKKTINEFKWKDYCQSLNLKYEPFHLHTLYDHDFMRSIVDNKINYNFESINALITKGYLCYQDFYVEKKVLNQLNKIKKREPQLSNFNLLNAKKDQLLDILYNIVKDYS